MLRLPTIFSCFGSTYSGDALVALLDCRFAQSGMNCQSLDCRLSFIFRLAPRWSLARLDSEQSYIAFAWYVNILTHK